jgi:hypothetical protein
VVIAIEVISKPRRTSSESQSFVNVLLDLVDDSLNGMGFEGPKSHCSEIYFVAKLVPWSFGWNVAGGVQVSCCAAKWNHM